MLAKAVKAVEAKLGKKNDLIVYDPKRKVNPLASSGSLIINMVSGIDGLLVPGRIVEIFGGESCVTGDTVVEVRIDGVEKSVTMLELMELYDT